MGVRLFNLIYSMSLIKPGLEKTGADLFSGAGPAAVFDPVLIAVCFPFCPVFTCLYRRQKGLAVLNCILVNVCIKKHFIRIAFCF